ncbi:MAG: response regulator transcription factor [Lachnospiraceae bacterium]|nr:response regulator transcription factor [Lachnospiraceae bacterium]
MKDGTILIVEDHKEIRDMLEAFLTQHGYEVECACNGKEASACIRDKKYMMVLMDLMLPYKSGDVLIKELREQADTPVICLSAKSGMETRLEVLRMGADDYILKPFDLDEVLVRIEVVLRRSGKLKDNAEMSQSEVLSCVGLLFHIAEKRVEYQGKNIALTSKELQILKLLLEHPSKTFTKANLYESVWNSRYFYEDNTINVHVSNLRNKLKKATGHDYIETVWGIGYRLKEEQPEGVKR